MADNHAQEHYRYEYTRDPERAPRPPWRVRQIVNDGHTGSLLNCPHPACVLLRLTAEHPAESAAQRDPLP